MKIKIKNGEFHYSEKNIPVKYFIKNVNLESTGKRYDSDTIAVQMSFIPGIGTGTIKGNITINFETLDDLLLFTIQEKCISYVGTEIIDGRRKPNPLQWFFVLPHQIHGRISGVDSQSIPENE
jgi:hypothetical protein